MTQSRKNSVTEAVINVLIGYTVNMMANFLIFPLFGWHISLRDNFLLGVFYTAISIVRNYCIRRWFNGLIKKASA